MTTFNTFFIITFTWFALQHTIHILTYNNTMLYTQYTTIQEREVKTAGEEREMEKNPNVN